MFIQNARIFYDYLYEVCYDWCQESEENEGSSQQNFWSKLSDGDKEHFKKAVADGEIAKKLYEKARGIIDATKDFELLVLLGDSLSDQGRMSRRTLGLVIPLRGKADLTDSRTGAFSNSINWVDRIMIVAVLAHLVVDSVDSVFIEGRVGEDLGEMLGGKKLNPENLVVDVLKSHFIKRVKMGVDSKVLRTLEEVLIAVGTKQCPLDLSPRNLREKLEGTEFNRLKFEGEHRIINFSEGGASSTKGNLVFTQCLLKTLEIERNEFLEWWKKKVEEKKWTLPEVIAEQKKVRIFEMTGANDLLTVNAKATFAIAKSAVNARIENVIKLYNRGFRHFILGSLPDLSLTPKFQNQSAAKQEDHYRIVMYFNRYLQRKVGKLLDRYPELSISLYDINKPFGDAYVEEVAISKPKRSNTESEESADCVEEEPKQKPIGTESEKSADSVEEKPKQKPISTESEENADSVEEKPKPRYTESDENADNVLEETHQPNTDGISKNNPEEKTVGELTKDGFEARINRLDDPRYKGWRDARLGMTSEIDRKLYGGKGFNLSRMEYNTLLDMGVHKRLFVSNESHENNEQEKPKSIKRDPLVLLGVDLEVGDDREIMEALFNHVDNTCAAINFSGNDVAATIRKERLATTGTDRLTFSEWIDKQKRLTVLDSQRRVLNKLTQRLSGLHEEGKGQKRKDFICFIKGLLQQRRAAYFYNRLHPSRILYNKIAQDAVKDIMVNPITNQRSPEERTRIRFQHEDAVRKACLTYVRLRDAKDGLDAWNPTDDASKYEGDIEVVNNLGELYNSLFDDKEKTSLFILASFLKDYIGNPPTDCIKKSACVSLPDFDLKFILHGEGGQTSDLEDNNTLPSPSQMLTNLFYHALFGGKKKVRDVFQKLGYLTYVTCAVPYRLLDDEGLSVVCAARTAYKRALQVRGKKSLPAADKTLGWRIDNLNLWSGGFEFMLIVRALYFQVKAPALKHFIKLHPLFFMDSSSNGEKLSERMQKISAESGPIVSQWAELILKAGLLNEGIRRDNIRRRNMLTQYGLSKNKLQRRNTYQKAQVTRQDYNQLSRDRRHQTRYDDLVRLLPS